GSCITRLRCPIDQSVFPAPKLVGQLVSSPAEVGLLQHTWSALADSPMRWRGGECQREEAASGRAAMQEISTSISGFISSHCTVVRVGGSVGKYDRYTSL